MKKILFLIAMTVAPVAPTDAQSVDIKKIREINFYGVDFSLATAPDVEEIPERFKGGLIAINDLLYREVNKYNFKKYMGKEILAYNFSVTGNNNEQIDAQQLTARTVREKISDADIRAIISPLSTDNNATVGLVFIAETLSKARRSGVYHVVFFDEATHEIIYSRKITGRAGGFGVRNYWAASIFNILRTWHWR
ncbi:MAG: hypothetical protein LBD87_00040 [Prevotellaceae bacterium]|jgi:hypothetical protein|nr:hypothetical protein [Prevotellaceae bacterium]